MTDTTAQQRLDAMIAKVEKIMRKAERAGSPEEAQAFFEGAQRLMAQHGIDEAMLRLSEPEMPAEEAITSDMIIKRSGFFDSMVRLAIVIAEANDVRCLVKNGKDWGSNAGVRFIGMDSDIAKAKMLYTSLLAQCMRERRNIPDDVTNRASWMDDGAGKHYTQKWRRDFSIGFAARIGTRLRQVKKETEAAAVRSDTSGRLLPALADRKAVVDRLYDSQFTVPGRARSSRSGPMADAFEAGGRAADRADLGQPRTGSGTSGALNR